MKLAIFLLIIIEHFSFFSSNGENIFFPYLSVLHFRSPKNDPSSLSKKASGNISNGFPHSRPVFGKQQHKTLSSIAVE